MTGTTLPPNLEAILADLMPAAERLAAQRRRRARRRRLGVLAAVVVAIASPASVAALGIIGGPAPPAVQRDLLAVDRGLPADLRLNPDVAHAHAVAASGDSVVYFAGLADGGYCAELVTAKEGPRGAVCSTAAQVDETPLDVTVPFTDPVEDSSPVTASGHVGIAAARTIELVYPDGGSSTVPLGEERFYVADVPAAHLTAVHRQGLMLIARDADGDALAQAVVPTDAITPPSGAERPHDPIEIDTVSDGRDLTKVLRVRGRLYVDGATRLTLRYPDGATVRLALAGDRFDYAVPRERRHDLMTPGTLTAYGADGRELARRPVAAVAYWRARERGRGRSRRATSGPVRAVPVRVPPRRRDPRPRAHARGPRRS
jgi:hypothetical protein